MARKSPKREVTYADLEEVPPNKVGEILEGELVVSPRPASRHARAATRLSGMLLHPFDLGDGGPGGWIILMEPELHLSGDALVPDLAGWRRERMPVMPDTPAFSMAPDWVCEVASPSTTSIDRGPKMRIYAREGVRHLWLIEPLEESLEVYRLAEDGCLRVRSVYGGAATVRAEPFDEVPLELGALWAL
jgi:Uma2 family endonuclease